jgi:predicted metal-dependent phosphoesterase TrpH
VAVLAHPAAYRQAEGLISGDQLAELVQMGLDGVEVYHFRLDELAREHFLAIARRFNLVVTGGSDEHGWRPAADRTGSEPVSAELVAALRARARA